MCGLCFSPVLPPVPLTHWPLCHFSRLTVTMCVGSFLLTTPQECVASVPQVGKGGIEGAFPQ